MSIGCRSFEINQKFQQFPFHFYPLREGRTCDRLLDYANDYDSQFDYFQGYFSKILENSNPRFFRDSFWILPTFPTRILFRVFPQFCLFINLVVYLNYLSFVYHLLIDLIVYINYFIFVLIINGASE